MTAKAWELLDAELIDLAVHVARLASSGPDEDDDDGNGNVIDLQTTFAVKRLRRLREVMAEAKVSMEPDRAVIGRRVTLRETDGDFVTYALVVPGDGAPTEGRISADSPLGGAILHRQPGATVEIAAPGGMRMVTVESVD